MKKFLICLFAFAMCAVLAMGALAAETVIYENDFSNPNTINDFKAYRMYWDIKDGGLYLSEDFIDGTQGASLDTSFAHLIYQTDEKLTDYIIEVDYMNIQTAGGVIFRSQQDKADSKNDGFYGYISFIGNNANCGALGCGSSSGGWKGNINVGKTGNCNISSNVHIKTTVKGNMIHTLITNIDNGRTVYEYTYEIGSNAAADEFWAEGTFGLRMRAGLKANDAYSANNAYFDNLKVTTANEVDLGGSATVIPPEPQKLAIDTSDLTVVYENKFDKFTDLTDFKQYRGTWSVFDGKLYLSAASGTQSYILFAGDEKLTKLGDYVVDVDMYNTQTQGGIVIRSDLENVTGETDDGIMGYMGFISNDGKQGALGAGKADGAWLAGNIEVSSGSVLAPGSDIHLQVAVKYNTVQIVITDLKTGKVLWQWSEKNDLWSNGTFGFRLRGKATNAGLDNLNNTAFDNLVVSTFNDPTPPLDITPEPEKPAEPSTPVTPFVPTGDVIYENDFSDPATIAHFKQYRMNWEIKDGGLYLTDKFIDGTTGASLDTSFSHIIYQTAEKLTDYVVEVDYMNIQTAGGVIFRSQQDKVDSQQDGFYGYVSFIANNADKGALGCSGDAGKWKGNIHVGASGNCSIGTNAHIKTTVKGDKIHTIITNLDTGATIYEYSYTIGTNTTADQIWNDGTFGLRMRAGLKANDAYSAGKAYFDNFRVTVAKDDVTGGDTTVEEPKPAEGKIAIDTTSLIPVYENKFEDLSSIKDFEQFRGTWTVFNGQLYLSAATGTQSYILFAGDEALTSLDDYVVDVDMYNTQTQGGIILRSDFSKVTGDADDGFYGYMGFISNDGKLGAIGASKEDGKWLDGNIEVSAAPVIQNGSDIHLQFAVKGNMLQLVITDINTGKVLWQWSEENDLWTKGTFGFRLRGKATNAGLDNLNNTSFDNLVVSKFGESKRTEVKLTVGSTKAYINGVEQTLDAAPINRNGRILLPVRFLANAFGVSNDGIKWDAATRTATLTNSTTTIVVTINEPTMTVNGQSVALDVPATIEQGRTYLPLRAIANALGVSNDNIAWDAATSTATLIK